MVDRAERDPQLAEYLVRRDAGVRDDGQWAEVSRAVEEGRAAPVPLRSAAAEVARLRIRTVRAELGRPRWTHALLLLGPEWLLWWLPGPRARRRRLQRLEAALAANTQPRPD